MVTANEYKTAQRLGDDDKVVRENRFLAVRNAEVRSSSPSARPIPTKRSQSPTVSGSADSAATRFSYRTMKGARQNPLAIYEGKSDFAHCEDLR